MIFILKNAKKKSFVFSKSKRLITVHKSYYKEKDGLNVFYKNLLQIHVVAIG